MKPPAGTGGDDPRRQQLIELYEAEFDGIYQFSLARCGDRATAEDVAAETFYAAATALAEGREETIGRPWLFTVARRRLVDHWRRTERQRRRVLRLMELGETHDQVTIDVDPVDLPGEAVLVALRSLPPRQRAAIALRYLDDHSVSEIAEAMDIEYRAAESLLARGRRSFIAAWEAR